MKNNEFFNAMKEQENKQFTAGERNAYYAWQTGIQNNLDFPVQNDSMFDKEVSDFLATLEKAGFQKFGYYCNSTNARQNIVDFLKAGWQLTGIFELENPFEKFGYKPDEGLVFERRF